MAESGLPRSPFAGMAGLSASRDLRVLSRDQIEQILAAHRLYVETERRQGRRADLGSADLSGLNFSGLNLRRVKMDRAVLKGADFTGARLERANLIGALLAHARLDSADLTGARLSGANLVSASLRNALLDRGRDGVRPRGQCRARCCLVGGGGYPTQGFYCVLDPVAGSGGGFTLTVIMTIFQSPPFCSYTPPSLPPF